MWSNLLCLSFLQHRSPPSPQRVVEGEATFSLPVFLRRDGLALRVGQVVNHNGGRFALRNILVTSGGCQKCKGKGNLKRDKVSRRMNTRSIAYI